MEDFVAELTAWLRLGVLAAFGGAASYIYLMITKNRPFRWITFLANLFIAFFVGKAMGGFIPEGTRNFSGVVMLMGFCAYPVLGIVEEKIVSYINKRIAAGGPGQ